MGDYNINLLNYESHDLTANFVNTIYSYSCVPLINRSTMVTQHSATLTDNILTNNHNALLNSYQGILLTDVSDHFPVIHINANFTANVQDVSTLKRSNSSRNKQAFLEDWIIADWDSIYKIHDTQLAFSQFHSLLLSLFNKNFPKKEVKIRYINRTPWLSDWLQASIKHKNILYYKSLKYKTAYNELKYVIEMN